MKSLVAPNMSASVQELKRRLHDEGFLHIPKVLSDVTLAECQNKSAEYVGEILRSLLLTQLMKMQHDGTPEPTRFAECVERDGGRLDIRHEPTDSVFAPILTAAASTSSQLGDVLVSMLGESCEVVAAGNVVAMCPHGWIEAGLAGDEDDDAGEAYVLADSLGEQAWHADGPHLFDDDDGSDRTLPPHAFTCFFPMVDLTVDNGPTEFVPGSHIKGREYSATAAPERSTRTPLAKAGDCVIFDYRLWHRGLPNRSDSDRPVLYLVVSRPWWTDSRNYRQEKSLFTPRDQSSNATAKAIDQQGNTSTAGRAARQAAARKLPALGILPQRVRLRLGLSELPTTNAERTLQEAPNVKGDTLPDARSKRRRS